jgi:phosphoglycerate kinase
MFKIDTFDFAGKKAIARVDFNVPLDENFVVTDDTRIRAAVPTIRKVTENGSIILMSHLGRPKGVTEKYSLKPVISKIEELTGKKVKFATDCIGEVAEKAAADLKPGEILLLENLRFYAEEEKGDKEFAKKLAKLADIYINDAFGTAHRAHASTAVIADFYDDNHKLFGYVMEGELHSLDQVLRSTKKPVTAIIGGAKVSSKITIIENLLQRVDNLIIGGGMTFTFVKAIGGKIGSSLVEDDYIETAKTVIAKAKERGVKLYLPVDSVNADKFAADANVAFSAIDQIPDGWMGLDIGDRTIQLFSEVIERSAVVLWNGPTGVFEMEKFEKGTVEIAKSLVKATVKGAFTLVGGGDSVAAINKYGMETKVSYVSTGGGAMLEFLEGKVLPGVACIPR